MSSKTSGLPRLQSGSQTPAKASRESLSISYARKDSAQDNDENRQRDWIIGDRCYLSSGTKPGKVAFLGETRFGTGEWAGVVLDEPQGKNDGSVNGVRYFQCTPNHGLFCRIDKLSREPITEGGTSSHETTPSDSSKTLRKEDQTSLSASSTVTQDSPQTELNKLLDYSFKVGDRVCVFGSLDKRGVIRFLGQTKFAQGQWAGLELDNPVGKNDGLVQGERYFICKPRYGVFVPVTKLILDSSRDYSNLKRSSLSGSTSNLSMVSCSSSVRNQPSLPVRHNVASTLRIQKAAQGSKAGSQESLCSGVSQFSSASRRVRLGVASLQSPATGSLASTKKRLMSALEADEVSATPDHLECHKNLTALKMQMDQLCLSLQQAVKETKRLENLYDEERKKTDDLQFRLEEELAGKQHLEIKMSEMEKLLTDVPEKDGKQYAELSKKSENATKNAKKYQLLLEEEKSKVETLQFSLDEETVCRNAVEKQVEGLQCEICDLKSHFEKANTRASADENEITQLRKKLEHLETCLADEKSASVNLEAEKTNLFQNCEGLRARLENFEAEEKSYKTSIEQLTTAQRTYEDKIKDLQGEISTFKNAAEHAKLDEASVVETLRKAEAENQEIKTIHQATLAELDLVKNQMSDKEKAFQLQVDNLKQENDNLLKTNSDQEVKIQSFLLVEKELEKLKDKQKESARLLEQLQTEAEAKEKASKNLESKVGELAEEIRANEVDHKQTMQKIVEENRTLLDDTRRMEERFSDERQELKKQIEQLTESVKNLNTELIESQAKCVDLNSVESELSKLKVERDELQLSYDKNKNELNILNEKFQLLQTVNAGACENERKNVELLERIQTLTDENSSLVSNLQQLQTCKSDNDVLQEKLKDSSVEIKELIKIKAGHSELTTKYSELTLSFDQSKEELFTLKRHIEALNNKNSEFENRTSELQKERKKLEVDNSSLRVQIEEFETCRIENQNLRESVANFECEKNVLQQKVDQLENDKVEQENVHKTTVDQLRSELDSVKQKIALDNENLTKDHNETLRVIRQNFAEQTQNLESKTGLENSLRSEIDGLKILIDDEKKSAASTLTAIQAERESFKSSCEMALKQVEDIKRKLSSVQASVDAEKDGNARLTVEVNMLKDTAAKSNDELVQKYTKDIELLKTENEHRTKELDSACQKEKFLEFELNKCKADSASLLELEKEQKLQLQKTCDQLQLTLNELETNFAQLQDDFRSYEIKCKNLEEENKLGISELEEMSKNYEKDKAESRTYKKQLDQLLEECLTSGRLIENLTQENCRLNKLTKTSNSAQVSDSNGLTTTTSSSTNAEQLECHQVNFLNSVIADLVDKNRDLQLKVDIFYSGGAENLGSVDALLKKQPKPRKFCDICDIFDAHETEDCPQQAGPDFEDTLGDRQTHSKSHGPKGQQRPYCEHCEAFVHATEDCDMQTF